MSDYTVEMFCSDHDTMLPILKVLKNVSLPEEDWPKLNIEGTIYRLNPNFTEVDTIAFFKNKYGKDKGFDYAMRFLRIIWFINEYRDDLFKEHLIRRCGNQTEIVEELLQVMLDSFSPPKLPVVFPASFLDEKWGTFSYDKVLKAVKPILRNDD